MEHYAHELRDALASGRLAGSGSVELSDGLIVNLERMARITVAEFERLSSGTPGRWGAAEQQQLYADLERLHAEVFGRPATARPVETPDAPEVLGLSPETVRRIIRAGTLEVATPDRPSGVMVAPTEHVTQGTAEGSGQDRLSEPPASAAEGLTATIRSTLTPIVAELEASRRATERRAEEDRARIEVLTRLASDLGGLLENLRALEDLATDIRRMARTSVELVTWLIIAFLGGAAWWLLHVT